MSILSVNLQEIARVLILNMRETSPWEYIAVFTGILSVWLSKIENIWLYPTGLINTVIYIAISVNGHLYGEASVNFYYTVMSIYGWVLWARKDEQHNKLLTVSFSSGKEWMQELGFFALFYIVLYGVLSWLRINFNSGTIPWADAFASATAYTGMWLMAKKKAESWYWWILTDLAAVPLYFVKGYVFTSFYYIVLLVLAVTGLISWTKTARSAANRYSTE